MATLSPLDQRFRQRTDVVARLVAGEMMLVPLRVQVADMRNLFVLDEVGEFIWRQLDGQRTVREVADLVVRAYDVERPRATTDLVEVLGALERAGLTERI